MHKHIIAFLLLLGLTTAACQLSVDTAAPTPTPTRDLPPPAISTTAATAIPPGTLTGFVRLAVGETIPQMAVYAVSVENPGTFERIGVLAQDAPEAPFTLTLAGGPYFVYGYANDGTGRVFAYSLTPDGPAAITVNAGETTANVILSLVPTPNPEDATTTCTGFAVPPSPDGEFDGLPGPNPLICAPTPTPTPTEVVDPTAGRAALLIDANGATPPTNLYFFDASTNRWTSFETPANPGPLEYVATLPAGDYVAFAYPQGGSVPLVYSLTGSGLSLITIRAGQTTPNITLTPLPTGECQGAAIPATPDGRYPAIAGPNPDLCNNVALGQGRVVGTLRLPNGPTPKTKLYLLNPSNGVWYTLGLAPEAGPTNFSITVDAGTYQVFGWTDDGTNIPLAYYTNPRVLALITVAPGQTLSNINLTTLPAAACQGFAIPAAPDGLFPARPGPDPAQCDASGNPISGGAARLTGTVGLSGSPTTAVTLYLRNTATGEFLTFNLPAGPAPLPFDIQAPQGTYELFAYSATGEPFGIATNQNLTPVAVYTGLTSANLRLLPPGSGPCAGLVLPATPDGRPALNTTGNTCDADGHVIRAEGQITLSTDAFLDLDSGAADSATADLQLRVQNGTLALFPVNSAILANMQAEPSFDGCGAVIQFGQAPADPLAAGRWLCLVTSSGRPARVGILAVNPGSVTLSFRTWGQ